MTLQMDVWTDRWTGGITISLLFFKKRGDKKMWKGAIFKRLECFTKVCHYKNMPVQTY